MNNNKHTYVINILLPCVVFSAIAGILTSIVIFLFKICSSHLIHLSEKIYAAARADLRILPLLLIGAAVIGTVAALILKASPDSRGGGIPTAIAALRGLIPLKKTISIITVFFSSLLTFLCGVPLGTEGPSVQMGAISGKLTARLFEKDHSAWKRYIMTGGACAGFGAATGAPLTGIFFAFEEAHKRFSPMLFMISAMAVAFCTATTELLCSLFSLSPDLFHFEIAEALPLKYIWVSIAVGILCAGASYILTIAYRFKINHLDFLSKKIPFSFDIILIFVLTAVIGLFSKNSIGTGHSLIDELIEGGGVWFLLPIYFVIRAIMMIIANTRGVTGGLFVPNLTFGAIIGALCAKACVALEILPKEYYTAVVVIGMVSFLGASSRTPITAITFAIEALSGFANILPIIVGVTIAFITIEATGITAFTDTVIEGKAEQYNHGLTPKAYDMYLTVKNDAFAIGKEVKDILWPPSTVIVSVNNAHSKVRIGYGMAEGDVLHIHIKTAHIEESKKELEALLGKQEKDAFGDEFS